MARKDEEMDVTLDRFLKEEPEPQEEEAGQEAAGEADGALDETPGVEELEAEIAQLKDRLMRALADAENTRKRAARDRRDAELYGGQKLARDLLTVYDNMARALLTVTDEQREANKALIEGIELTSRELIAVFERHGIRRIAPQKGDKFDPNLHQAMFEAPVADVPAGHIVQVMQEGFLIGERLLRPAHVGVSSGAPS